MSTRTVEIQINFMAFDKLETKVWPYNTPFGEIYEQLHDQCKTFQIKTFEVLVNGVIIKQK